MCNANCMHSTPAGKCCVTRSVVADVVEFDKTFSCDCALLDLDVMPTLDANCQPVEGVSNSLASQHLAFGIGIGLPVIFLVIFLLVYRHRQNMARLIGRRKAQMVHHIAEGVVSLSEVELQKCKTPWMVSCDYDETQVSHALAAFLIVSHVCCQNFPSSTFSIFLFVYCEIFTG